MMIIIIRILLILLCLLSSSCYKNTNKINHRHQNTYKINEIKDFGRIETKLHLENGGLATLIASAIGGSCGIGVAYPLDSIKTKIQCAAAAGEAVGMKKMFIEVYKKEGVIKGFYSGLFPTMVGQSFYIASAFSANTWALTQLTDDGSPTLVQLCLAGAIGGLAASFVINPIERIKIQMQTNMNIYSTEQNSYGCLVDTIKSDGIFGLLFRGIDATFLREVPGYALYFLVYSYLSQQAVGLTDPVHSIAPLFCGAAAGVISWVPIYPFDVIKTFQQNTLSQGDEESNNNMMGVAKNLKNKFGWNIFYKGITPKLYKAIVSDSVTFMVYEMVLKMMGITSVMSH